VLYLAHSPQTDAEEASMNLKLISFTPKPAGFFDPNNPSGMPPVITDDNEEFENRVDDGQSLDGTEWSDRSPLLSFSNTDMAFHKDVLVAGNYHGFNIYKLQDDGIPKLHSSIVCPGGQGDVSIIGDLLLMSVEQTRGRVDCGLQGVSEDVSEDRFRGLRIFDISNLAVPVQVGRIPGDNRTALFRIDVIEIPLADPSKSRIIDSPAVFADEETGRLAGLWQGGDHGDSRHYCFS